MNRKMWLMAMAVGSVASLGLAEESKFIQRLDHDADGRVSEQEFDGPSDHFMDLDRNGDGYIAAEEAPSGPPPPRMCNDEQGGKDGQRPMPFIKRLDRDGDNRVSEKEFDGPVEHFTDFDKNADGYITEDEAPSGPPPGRLAEASNRDHQ